MKKVQNESIAEDIVQEVMLKLVESHYSNKSIKNVKAWLFQVARNTIFDYLNQKQLDTYNSETVYNFSNQEASEFEISIYDYMIPMIQFLPQKYAEPLLLNDIEKKPQIEIARTLGLSLSAVKMRVLRARIKLRETFINCCDIEYDSKGNFVSCTVKKECNTLHHHLNTSRITPNS